MIAILPWVTRGVLALCLIAASHSAAAPADQSTAAPDAQTTAAPAVPPTAAPAVPASTAPAPTISIPAAALPVESPRARIGAALKGKYLDCHVHTAGIGSHGSGCYVGKGLRGSWKFSIYLKSFLVTEDELKQHGDGLVMERVSALLAKSKTVGAAVILALDGPVDSAGNLDSARTELYVPNDFVAREVRKYPNLLFGASINPKRPDAIARLRKAKADGAVLVKWLPPIMHFDPADTTLVPFYLVLKELGLPLLTHAGKESAFNSANEAYGDPKRLELAALLGVTVIAAHVATPGENEGVDNHERLMTLFPKHPTLYADISSLTQINKLFLLPRILPRAEVEGRLIFGSDFPLINTKLVSSWYYLHKLSFKQVREISAVENPWDRSVTLKKALGVQEDVFRRTEELLLGLPGDAAAK